MNQYLKCLQTCMTCEHQQARRCGLLKQPIANVARSSPWACPLESKRAGFAGDASVDVVVTCHNYGRYLRECLDSILSQTATPRSVIVVDDGSTDETPDVCQDYANRVESIRVNHLDVVRSRRSGMLAGDAEFVLFVDADNVLSPRFVETAVAAVDSRNVVCVYPNIDRFGDETSTIVTPSKFSRTRLMAGNYIDNCSLLRRSALEILDLPDYWQGEEKFALTSEDYVLFQSLARIGGEFRKNPTPLNYRVHGNSDSVLSRPARMAANYPRTHGIDQQSITLFVPLSGRSWAWPRFAAWLDDQRFDHKRIRLVLCDTSQSEAFSRTVRDWLHSCDYDDQRYFKMNASTPGIADVERRKNLPVQEEINHAMCRIYNRMRSELATDYVMILEDDIIPPIDVIERLFCSFAPDVASVFAPYPSRFAENYVCWSTGCPGKQGGGPVVHSRPPGEDADQVEEIQGSGFGCLLMRSGVVKDHFFQVPGNHKYYDPHFFDSMPRHWKRLVDWSCLCEHREEVV